MLANRIAFTGTKRVFIKHHWSILANIKTKVQSAVSEGII